MQRTILPFLAFAALAGCGQPVTSQPAGEAPAAPPAATTTAPAAPAQASLSPEERRAARYVGIWSEASSTCASAPWTFTADKLSTPDGVTCDVSSVSETPEGYDVAAQCAGKAAPAAANLKLRFVEAAKGVLVEGGPFPAPVGLIRCEG